MRQRLPAQAVAAQVYPEKNPKDLLLPEVVMIGFDPLIKKQKKGNNETQRIFPWVVKVPWVKIQNQKQIGM